MLVGIGEWFRFFVVRVCEIKFYHSLHHFHPVSFSWYLIEPNSPAHRLVTPRQEESVVQLTTQFYGVCTAFWKPLMTFGALLRLRWSCPQFCTFSWRTMTRRACSLSLLIVPLQVRMGGDVDSTASMAGNVSGALNGWEHIQVYIVSQYNFCICVYLVLVMKLKICFFSPLFHHQATSHRLPVAAHVLQLLHDPTFPGPNCMST